MRLPPVTDLIDLVLAVVDDPAVCSRDGSTIVLVPSIGWAERLTARLRRRGCPATGSWEEARAGWPVVVGAARGRGRRCRGWPPPSSWTPTSGLPGRRRPPTARSTCLSSEPGGRGVAASWRHRSHRSGSPRTSDFAG